MIKQFRGRKFKTRDGKYNANIVARRYFGSTNEKFIYWVILTAIDFNSDRPEIYLSDLSKYGGPEANALDLIEVEDYDWPLMCPVFVWDDNSIRAFRSTERFFGGVNSAGKPTTWYRREGEWHKFTWDHAERIELPEEKEDG